MRCFSFVTSLTFPKIECSFPSLHCPSGILISFFHYRSILVKLLTIFFTEVAKIFFMEFQIEHGNFSFEDMQ